LLKLTDSGVRITSLEEHDADGRRDSEVHDIWCLHMYLSQGGKLQNGWEQKFSLEAKRQLEKKHSSVFTFQHVRQIAVSTTSL
jgi:hypothetical protein